MTLLVDECCARDKTLLTTISYIATSGAAIPSNTRTSNLFVFQTNT